MWTSGNPLPREFDVSDFINACATEASLGEMSIVTAPGTESVDTFSVKHSIVEFSLINIARSGRVGAMSLRTSVFYWPPVNVSTLKIDPDVCDIITVPNTAYYFTAFCLILSSSLFLISSKNSFKNIAILIIVYSGAISLSFHQFTLIFVTVWVCNYSIQTLRIGHFPVKCTSILQRCLSCHHWWFHTLIPLRLNAVTVRIKISTWIVFPIFKFSVKWITGYEFYCSFPICATIRHFTVIKITWLKFDSHITIKFIVIDWPT